MTVTVAGFPFAEDVGATGVGTEDEGNCSPGRVGTIICEDELVDRLITVDKVVD